MPRNQSRRRIFTFGVDTLETRALLTHFAPRIMLPSVVEAVASRTAAPPPVKLPGNVFNHPGIYNFNLKGGFLNQLGLRLAISGNQAGRVVQAFQDFQDRYKAMLATPAGTPNTPTLSDLVTRLQTFVDNGLTYYQIFTVSPSTSVVKSLKVSPYGNTALIPFANAQVAQVGATLASNPPVDITPVLNAAVNSILNSVAEFSVHPQLFTRPSDFYINPYVKFDLTYTGGAPAQAAQDYFLRGPHGEFIPGAILHPHLPA